MPADPTTGSTAASSATPRPGWRRRRSPDLPWEVGVAKPDPAMVVDKVTRTFGGLTAVSVDHLEIQRGGITG